VNLWDITRREGNGTLTRNGEYKDVRSLTFGKSNDQITVLYADAVMEQWQLPDKRLLLTEERYENESGWLLSAAFNADARVVVMAWIMIPEAKAWHVTEEASPPTFSGHRTDIYSIAISPDSELVASGSGRSYVSEEVNDDTIYVWRMTDASAQIRFTGNKDSVRSLAWSPDGKLLASGSDDGTVRLWQVK
jgi:WD40 repeat protein